MPALHPEPAAPAPVEPRPARSRVRIVWLLAALALVSCAAGAVRLSSATFSSTSSAEAGDLAAGTLQLKSPADGLVAIDASNMRPGDTRHVLVTLTASGDVRAFWSVELNGEPTGSAALAHTLVLTLAKDAGSQQSQTLYEGPLDELTRTAIGSSDPSADLPVRIALEWPADASDPALPGKSTAAQLLWRAASS
jgi:hypothetical protein